jgi:hypothetical protein
LGFSPPEEEKGTCSPEMTKKQEMKTRRRCGRKVSSSTTTSLGFSAGNFRRDPLPSQEVAFKNPLRPGKGKHRALRIHKAETAVHLSSEKIFLPIPTYCRGDPCGVFDWIHCLFFVFRTCEDTFPNWQAVKVPSWLSTSGGSLPADLPSKDDDCNIQDDED